MDPICPSVLLYYRCSNSYAGHVARQVVLVSRHSWKSFLSSGLDYRSSVQQFLLSVSNLSLYAWFLYDRSPYVSYYGWYRYIYFEFSVSNAQGVYRWFFDGWFEFSSKFYENGILEICVLRRDIVTKFGTFYFNWSWYKNVEFLLDSVSFLVYCISIVLVRYIFYN